MSERISYWAMIELYRTYLFEDGPFLETIRDAGGQLDAKTLSRIAHSYSVSRTIPSSPKSDGYNLQILWNEIKDLQKRWPTTLDRRAEECRISAIRVSASFQRQEKSEGKGRSPGAPHSAITKLIWFVEPNGWTVFDALASNAVLKSGGTAGERQQRFYRVIAEPFAHWTDNLRKNTGRFEPRLYAERLIDKYLLLTGLKPQGFSEVRTRNCHFLRLLPQPIQERLTQCALAVANDLPNGAFPKEATSKRSRERIS